MADIKLSATTDGVAYEEDNDKVIVVRGGNSVRKVSLPNLPSLDSATVLAGTNLFLTREDGASVDTSVTAADVRLFFQKNTGAFYATDYGAKFDGMRLTDCTWSSSAKTISSASYSFTAADVGKCVAAIDSATATVYRKLDTIASVAAGVATVTGSNFANSVSGTGIVFFGTDDTVAIQAAVNAANPEDSASTGNWKYNKGGVVILPAGMAMITQEIEARTNVSVVGQGKFATHLKWASTQSMAQVGRYAIFHGGKANGSTRLYRNCQFRGMYLDVSAAFTTTYSYHAKCIEMLYSINPCYDDLYLDRSPGTAIGIDFNSNLTVTNNIFDTCGRLWAEGGGGGSGLDFQTDATSNYTVENQLLGVPQTDIIKGNHFINCKVSAIRNTANNDTLTPTRRIVEGNIIKSNLPTGKGIEDNANTGMVIIGNTIMHTGTAQSTQGPIGSEGQHIWCGIMVSGGAGGACIGNTITGGWYDGIRLNRFQKSGSTLLPTDYLIMGNVQSGATRHGLHVEVDDTYTLKNVAFRGNSFARNGGAGVAFTNTGTAGDIEHIDFTDNKIYDNGQTTATDAEKSGIYVNTPIAGLNMSGNYIYDSGSTKQKYGMTVDGVAITDSLIAVNHIGGNTTSAVNLINSGTITGDAYGNRGYP